MKGRRRLAYNARTKVTQVSAARGPLETTGEDITGARAERAAAAELARVEGEAFVNVGAARLSLAAATVEVARAWAARVAATSGARLGAEAVVRVRAARGAVILAIFAVTTTTARERVARAGASIVAAAAGARATGAADVANASVRAAVTLLLADAVAVAAGRCLVAAAVEAGVVSHGVELALSCRNEIEAIHNESELLRESNVVTRLGNEIHRSGMQLVGREVHLERLAGNCRVAAEEDLLLFLRLNEIDVHLGHVLHELHARASWDIHVPQCVCARACKAERCRTSSRGLLGLVLSVDEERKVIHEAAFSKVVVDPQQPGASSSVAVEAREGSLGLNRPAGILHTQGVKAAVHEHGIQVVKVVALILKKRDCSAAWAFQKDFQVAEEVVVEIDFNDNTVDDR